MVFGNIISDKLFELNTEDEISVIEVDNVIAFNLLDLKAFSLIVITELGIMILSNKLSEKHATPID